MSDLIEQCACTSSCRLKSWGSTLRGQRCKRATTEEMSDMVTRMRSRCGLSAFCDSNRAALTAAQQRVAVLEAALRRIEGMCDVPPLCLCGRPKGLTAVVHCARAAIAEGRGK